MIRLFNTISQKKEEFIVREKGKVTLYVCGITPYDTTHLGHAFTYITFDVLVKYLLYKGYGVNYTQNVTDINDRDNDILKRAQDQGIPWEQLATFWTDKFLKDMEILNWTKPTHYLWASQQIPAMITLIQEILENEYGYWVNGSVYLDVKKYKRYGVLSRLSESEMIRVAKEFEEDIHNPDKKHPLDITLWRATSKNQPLHIPSFESPFGPGRPGWHIECSAMSTASLGDQIDIHGGGVDLIYPHHESEITQSETATGKIPFVAYWMHVSLVQMNHEKMSKSKGNLVMVSDLLKKYSANAIRWMLLSHHYRESWNFSEAELIHAEEVMKRLAHVLSLSHPSHPSSPSVIQAFEDAMNDDINTPKALDVLRRALETDSLSDIEKNSYAQIAQVLGFVF